MCRWYRPIPSHPAEASLPARPIAPHPPCPLHSRPRKPTAGISPYENLTVLSFVLSKVVQSSSFTYLDNLKHKFNAKLPISNPPKPECTIRLPSSAPGVCSGNLSHIFLQRIPYPEGCSLEKPANTLCFLPQPHLSVGWSSGWVVRPTPAPPMCPM